MIYIKCTFIYIKGTKYICKLGGFNWKSNLDFTVFVWDIKTSLNFKLTTGDLLKCVARILFMIKCAKYLFKI